MSDGKTWLRPEAQLEMEADKAANYRSPPNPHLIQAKAALSNLDSQERDG